MADARRLKYTLMLVIVAGSGLALLGATQNWYSIHLTSDANHSAAVVVQGSAAAPALTALSLAGLALAAALAIAGPVVRVVLGVLGVLLGGSLLLSAISAIAAPVQSATSAITTATGVAGDKSVADLVSHVDIAIWPWCAVLGGIVVVLASVGVLVTTRRWPGASRRFEATRFEPVEDAAGGPSAADVAPAPAAPDDETSSRERAIDSWDELSRGEDPTQ